MKKLLSLLLSLLVVCFVFVTNVFAANISAVEIFSSYGGWKTICVVFACFALIWIIRATKTKKDDEILDEYVSTGIEYALKVMPKDSKIEWVKFVGNALGKFSEIYTKTQKLPPDAKVYDKAKQLIEELTEIKQIEQSKAA